MAGVSQEGLRVREHDSLQETEGYVWVDKCRDQLSSENQLVTRRKKKKKTHGIRA